MQADFSFSGLGELTGVARNLKALGTKLGQLFRRLTPTVIARGYAPAVAGTPFALPHGLGEIPVTFISSRFSTSGGPWAAALPPL